MYKWLFAILFLCLPAMFFVETVQAEPYPTFTPEMIAKIQYGKKSPEIKNLQKVLNALGYTIADSGPGSDGQETDFFDARVKASLKEFQIENDLKVTEKFDTATAKTLNELVGFLNQNSEDNDLISSTYSTDISDVYGNDTDLNKDFFADGGVVEYFGHGTRDALSYVGNALNNYTDINITGVKGSNGEGTMLDKNTSKVSSKNTNPNPSPVESLLIRRDSVDSGNIFQDTITKTILGNAAVLFYDTFIAGPSKAFTKVDTTISTTSNNSKDIEASKQNVYDVDGSFNIFKCFNDPICSSF